MATAGLPDGESGSRHDRRKQAFETLACLRQFSRNTWAARVDLGPDMMRNEANDPFTVRWRQELRQPVDPNAAIRIEHDLDDDRIFKPRKATQRSPAPTPCAACARRAKRLPAGENLPP